MLSQQGDAPTHWLSHAAPLNHFRRSSLGGQTPPGPDTRSPMTPPRPCPPRRAPARPASRTFCRKALMAASACAAASGEACASGRMVRPLMVSTRPRPMYTASVIWSGNGQDSKWE